LSNAHSFKKRQNGNVTDRKVYVNKNRQKSELKEREKP